MNLGIRRTSTLAAAAVLAAVAPGVAGAADPPGDRCSQAGRTTLRANEQVRVFTTQTDPDAAYACLRSTGGIRRMYRGDGVYSVGYIHALRGRYVAYSTDELAACKADCPPEVEPRRYATAVMDVLTGKRRSLGTNTPVDLRLRATGTVLFLTGAGPARELSVWDRNGRRVLDSGDILFRSVGLTDTRARWTNGTTPHVVTVG